MTDVSDAFKTLAKALRDEEYVLSEMTKEEQVDALFGLLATTQTSLVTAEEAATAAALLAAKRTTYLQKSEEFWMRAQQRFMELSEANGTWTLSSFPPIVAQACDETKAAMISEMS